jgi:hypothetical protein
MNTPTISSIHNGLELWILDFLLFSRTFPMYRAGSDEPALLSYVLRRHRKGRRFQNIFDLQRKGPLSPLLDKRERPPGIDPTAGVF